MVSARIFLLLFLTTVLPVVFAQNHKEKTLLVRYRQAIKERVDFIEENNAGSLLFELQELKNTYQKSGFSQNNADYAMLMHGIGLCKYYKGDYYGAVECAKQALAINTSGQPDCDAEWGAKNYRNIGYYYKEAANYGMAIRYYDSAVKRLQKYFPRWHKEFYNTCIDLCTIHADQGDYNEALECAKTGLQQTSAITLDDSSALAVLNQKAAQASAELAHTLDTDTLSFHQANKYLSEAEFFFEKNNHLIAKHLHNWNACKMTQAIIARYEKKLPFALHILKGALDTAIRYNNTDVQWMVLNNTAKYYADDAVKDYPKALALYLQMNKLQQKAKADTNLIAALYNDLGYVSSVLGNEKQSLQWFQRAYQLNAGPYAGASLLHIPTLAQLASRPGWQLIFRSLHNKAEMLMRNCKSRYDTAYIATSQKLFLLSDSLLTYIRHNQIGDESKLYWRTQTRNFFQQALEMCFVKKDWSLAFYYMEKSRAALLNDKLNDLRAQQFLPDRYIRQEDALKEEVLEKAYYLSKTTFGTPAYQRAFQQKDQADQVLSSFQSLLENKYPNYFRNKYADKVVAVSQLQQYLRNNHQQWVQYFLSDTLLFVLYANDNQLQLHRQVVRNFEQTLPWFLSKCANEKFQDNRDSFNLLVRTAAHIYDTLVRQACPHLQSGRLIVSPDNMVVPFDALCTNLESKRWMVHDYMVSYAYSARCLLIPSTTSVGNAKGSFLGMAPVKFPNDKLRSLIRSERAMLSFKNYYPDARIVIGSDANKKALLAELGNYKVVNLLTHASGSNSDSTEPQVYTADTPVRLSQLQEINNIATQVVILSACETNTGRKVTGEGVFSLARGFAVAGVPTAIATLWNADEKPTYFINDSLNKYISQGMCIDSALQKAKIAYIRQYPDQSPYYWANLTLMGSAMPVALQKEAHKISYWWGVIVLLLLGTGGVVAWQSGKKKKASSIA